MFSLNSVTKKICHFSKRIQTQATSWVWDQHATTVPARHMWGTRSLNWVQFILQWLSLSLNSLNSVNVLLHLAKTQMAYQMAQHWYVYSKIQNRFTRAQWAAPADRFLMQYLNNKCSLTICESIEIVVLNFWQPVVPPKYLELAIKLVHDIA